MALFEVASKHIARSTGSKTLHHIPDLNSAERFRVLCLVRREDSFWFWKKPKMYPTQITLQDILNKKMDLKDSTSATLLTAFKENPELKIDGDVGGKIAKELGVDFKAKDSVSVTLSLGNIVKTEINWEKLNDALKLNNVDMNHQLLTSTRKHKRRTLCLVLESVSTANGGDVKRETEFEISTDDAVTIPTPTKASVTLNTDDSLDDKVINSYTLPPNTVLAYSCNKFSLTEEGLVKLHPVIDNLDDSKLPFVLEHAEVSKSIDAMRLELNNLIDASKFSSLKDDLKKLASLRNHSLEALHLLLSGAELNLEHPSGDNDSIHCSVVSQMLGSDDIKWKGFLSRLGFIVPDNIHEGGARITYPVQDNDLIIKPCLGLLDVLADIPEESRQLLLKIPVDQLKATQNLVELELHKKTIKLKDINVDANSLKFLESVGFVLLDADNEKTLSYLSSHRALLMDIYTSLHAFNSL